MTVSDVPSELRGRTWNLARNAYAYLVDAPITLGHSQLVMRCKRSQQEQDRFNTAAEHAAKCIGVLHEMLSKMVFARQTSLARYTGTSGKYVKTLVLKASVKEQMNEYKIHLVPYFSSHLRLTNRLHAAIQELKPPASGGLLHWLGEREQIVDYDMREGRNHRTVKKRVASFHLQQMASQLRSLAGKATKSSSR